MTERSMTESDEAKRPLTFRTRPATLDRLRRRAREAGVSRPRLPSATWRKDCVAICIR